MPLAKDQNMIQALASKRPDQAFNIWILPRRPRSNGAIANPHPSHSVGKGLSVCAIIGADQIAWGRPPRKCLDDLQKPATPPSDAGSQRTTPAVVDPGLRPERQTNTRI